MKSIKILCIGNSFSDDMTHFCGEVFSALGYDYKVGNLYIGGCTLSNHLMHAKSNAPDYDFYLYKDGGCEVKKSSLFGGLVADDWDIITVQQASGFSGIAETYRANLWELLKFVRENATNKEAKIYWHKTWSYAKDSTHPHFVYYANDQKIMDESIERCYVEEVAWLKDISGVIKSGDAIKCGRELFFDSLTRDGFHLSPLGRYISALTFAFTVTGEEVRPLEIKPEGVSDEDAERAAICVKTVLGE